MTDLALDARLPDLQGEATVSATAQMAGAPVSLDATVEGFAASSRVGSCRWP